MIYNTVLNADTTELDKELWLAVTGIMQKIPTEILKKSQKVDVSFECHSICRGIAILVDKLRCVDGLYQGLVRMEGGEFGLTYCDHSWLVTPDDTIIDPYPVGFITVQPVIMASRGIYEHWGKSHYVPDSDVTKRISGRAMWRKSKVFAKIFDDVFSR